MALSSLHFRRALLLSSSLLKHRPFYAASAAAATPPPFSLSQSRAASPGVGSPSLRPHCAIQFLSFRSSPPSSDRRSGGDEGKISPDEILFEGCDYNHWLITMDFPKDPKPTPEEMVETYVQTLAKVVGSVEEAKKKMYACSTTTYNGFQAVMTEEMSEKFRGLPGVVFILPDSYIDPVNKEYGGDKYENGVITPRPPPVQYGRQGRYGDRNRNYDRPRYDRQREPMPMQQGNPSYDRQGSMQGDGRNYAPQQNYNQAGQDRRGYGPPGGGEFVQPVDRRDFGQGERRDYAQGGGGYNAPAGGGGYNAPAGGGGGGYNAPAGGGGYNTPAGGGSGGYNAPAGGGGYQGERRGPMSSYQRDFSQGERGGFASQERRDISQGQQVSGGGGYGQGPGSYGQNNSGTVEGQRYPQMEYKNSPPGEQTNYTPPGINQRQD